MQHRETNDAWERFFALCWDMWEEVERRRLANGSVGTGVLVGAGVGGPDRTRASKRRNRRAGEPLPDRALTDE